ncbi:hypothetical protein VKT23_001871 [Stygiomarasmius scandens]|uniref:Uncharacterized protein n=1 Tax=Marasmiellus scandens TaxID=2682957 RepID=A0ABR1K6D6_9AGAR
MLWSFDANLVHGTMLPSQETVLTLQGGYGMVSQYEQIAVTTGDHCAIRKKDANKAKKHANVQRCQRFRERSMAGA